MMYPNSVHTRPKSNSMKCELCGADLNSPGAVLITVKLPTRLNHQDIPIQPPATIVLVTHLDEEDVECAQCGELLRGIHKLASEP